jgi:hypothetical protein
MPTSQVSPKVHVTVETMSSPVFHLARHVPAAVVNIAPEKQSRILELLGDLDLSITDGGHWVCQALPELRVICISRAVLEWFWCQAYAYVQIYQEVTKHKHGSEIDLRGNAVTAQASHLLQWAFENCGQPRGPAMARRATQTYGESVLRIDGERRG